MKDKSLLGLISAPVKSLQHRLFQSRVTHSTENKANRVISPAGRMDLLVCKLCEIKTPAVKIQAHIERFLPGCSLTGELAGCPRVLQCTYQRPSLHFPGARGPHTTQMSRKHKWVWNQTKVFQLEHRCTRNGSFTVRDGLQAFFSSSQKAGRQGSRNSYKRQSPSRVGASVS